MNHPGHHTLELHVLGSLNGPESRSVEEHLAVCAGCKDLVDLISDFYDAADDNASAAPGPIEGKSALATRPGRDLSRFHEVYSAKITTLAETRFQRFVFTLRQHPVATGALSFGVIGAVALGLALAVPRFTRDKNPSAVSWNTSQELVEVYNARGEMLWGFHSAHLEDSWNYTIASKTSMVEAVDLNNDGMREIVMTLPYVGDERKDVTSLRALSADNELVFRVGMGSGFKYEDRRYDTTFSPTGFVVIDNGTTGRKDIFVAARHFRSPWYLGRFDNTGNQIGRFWHFGCLDALSVVDLEGDGHPEIVLCGINDVDDVTGREYPAIAVLDPLKVVGDRKSSATPGFGFPVSRAEIFYVRLPVADIDSATMAKGAVRAMLYADREKIGFLYQGNGTQRSAFEYVFGPDFRLLEVKGVSGVERLHAELRAQKKLKSDYGPDYLQNLGRQVQYWNGYSWQATPTRVLANR